MSYVAAAVFVAALLAISYFDLRERRVPNRIVLPAAAAAAQERHIDTLFKF